LASSEQKQYLRSLACKEEAITGEYLEEYACSDKGCYSTSGAEHVYAYLIQLSVMFTKIVFKQLGIRKSN